MEPISEIPALNIEQILTIQDLTTAFKIRTSILKTTDLLAVNNVSLKLIKGSTHAIVGESGCGKTTLVKTILNLVQASSGVIFYNGINLLKAQNSEIRKIRKNIQIVFQDPFSSLDPQFTVHDILAEPLIINGLYSRDKIDNILREVGLSNSFLGFKPSQFSGGQRQRIAIARALILDPQIVILDEPVSALDVSIQAQVLNLLNDLQKRLGLSYLFISHNLGVVRFIADEVSVMYLGRIVESGPTEALFSKPRHPYTRALLSAVPTARPSKQYRRDRIILRGDPPNPLKPPKGCAFHPRCYRAEEACKTITPRLTSDHDHGAHSVACLFPHE